MKDHHFRVWHVKEGRMYYRGYPKFLHVLLCEDDHGENEGRGRPVKRADYRDCFFLESTGLRDKDQREIFEGDLVRVRIREKDFTGVVGPVPDMFGTRHVHPLQGLLKEHGITGNPGSLDLEVLGNEYEGQKVAG